MQAGVIGTKGSVRARRIAGTVRAPLSWKVRNALRWSYVKGFVAWHVGIFANRVFNVAVMLPRLRAVKVCANGLRIDYGVVGYQMITTAFVNYMVDNLQAETTAWGDFKYHDSGVGTTDPAVGDVGIETTDGESRATGTQVEGASANVYKSVGTISYTTSKAITEHGLFSSAASTTLMDRSEFAAINVVNADSIEFTYELTCTAGG